MDQRMLVNLWAGLVPVVLGAIWYNPYLLGQLWPVGVSLTKEKATAGYMGLIAVLTLVAGYYVAQSLGSIVIHQHGVYSMLAGVPDMKDANSELSKTVQGLMDKYGTNYRTFKHGAYHGAWTGAKFALPILLVVGLVKGGDGSLGQRISWILIHAMFWTACLTLMGGIVCAYMP